MGMVLMVFLVAYFGVGLFVVMLFIRPRNHPVWFSVIIVIWALLPQFYWGAHTLKDYLAFREECRKLGEQDYRRIPDFGVPLVEGAAPSATEWIRSTVSAQYTEYSFGKFPKEWRDVPKGACPEIRQGDAFVQRFSSETGCYTNRQVDRIEAKYKIRMELSPSPKFPHSNYTKAFRYDYSVKGMDSGDGTTTSTFTEIELLKVVPWNFLLVPSSNHLAICGTNGIDRRTWLEILVTGEER